MIVGVGGDGINSGVVKTTIVVGIVGGAGGDNTPVGIETNDVVGNDDGTDVAGIMTNVVPGIVITVLTPVGTDDDLIKTGLDGNDDFGGKDTVNGAVVGTAGVGVGV
jgi:hypothetical protein